MIDASRAVEDPNLLAPWFAGPSWDLWRAVLRAVYVRPMSDEQVALFRSVADRNPPRQRPRELWVKAGRRAGKDAVASAIITAAALGDYRKHLRPGEMGTILCLACDRVQAKIVLGFVRGYFAAVPMLAKAVVSETAEGLVLDNGVEIVVAANSFRAVRGRAIVVAVLDEVAFFRDENSAKPDAELVAAIKPGLSTIPGSMLVGISSPYRKQGVLYERSREFFGKDDDEVLVIAGPSLTFNPTLDPKIIERALAEDPGKARSEWLGLERDDIESFVTAAMVEAVVADGTTEVAPFAGMSACGFVDAASGSGQDAMAGAVAFKDGDEVILAKLMVAKPPFDPQVKTAEFAEVFKSYGVHSVTGDRWAKGWVEMAFRNCGIAYRESPRSKSDIYLQLIPLINSRGVRLLDNKQMLKELLALERRTAWGGRESIDHPKLPSCHDDAINAAAGALVEAAGLVGFDAVPVAQVGSYHSSIYGTGGSAVADRIDRLSPQTALARGLITPERARQLGVS